MKASSAKTIHKPAHTGQEWLSQPQLLQGKFTVNMQPNLGSQAEKYTVLIQFIVSTTSRGFGQTSAFVLAFTFQLVTLCTVVLVLLSPVLFFLLASSMKCAVKLLEC